MEVGLRRHQSLLMSFLQPKVLMSAQPQYYSSLHCCHTGFICGVVAAFALQLKMGCRQAIEKATSPDFTVKLSVFNWVICCFPITGNIWPLCTTWERLRIWSHYFCLPLQCTPAPSGKWQKIQFMFNPHSWIGAMLCHRHVWVLAHTSQQPPSSCRCSLYSFSTGLPHFKWWVEPHFSRSWCEAFRCHY